MLQRDRHLNRIYEIIKIESRELTIDQLSDELGLSRRYTDRIIQASKDMVDQLGWMVGAVGYRGNVTIWDGNESSPDQKERKDASLEIAKQRNRRTIHIVYHQLERLVKEIGTSHPEYPFLRKQLVLAEVMRDAADQGR